MDFMLVLFYSIAAAIIMFLLTWGALLTHRFGLWVVIIGAGITWYTDDITGGALIHPYAAVMVFIILLEIAHILTRYLLREEEEYF